MFMLKVRRTVITAAMVCVAATGIGQVFAQAFQPEDYRKALWMVTRFYGAQRDGYGPNWLLMDHTYKTSFIRDGENEGSGIDLVGGWFDCGDHVLFGQTFFYSAYMLAKAYDAFPTGFHDDYNGFNYSDYAESAESKDNCKDWNMSCGKGDGIPDLLQELKYATDWIIKATPDANTFYYQKGRAKGEGGDHPRWETSAFKANTLNRADGGEVDVPRPVHKENAGVEVSSFGAATLAVMSRIYRKYDPDYADTCLAHAKLAYQYAKANRNNGTSVPEGCCYGPLQEPKRPIVLHIASAEMYKATNEQTYYDDMIKDKINRNWAFDYENPHDLAIHLSATTIKEEDRDEHIEQLRAIANFYRGDTATADTDNHSKGITNAALEKEWGITRYLGNHAFLVALHADLEDTDDYDHYIYRQIDFILGVNRRNYSFLVGFDAPGGMAQKPHHRNVYLNDENIPGNERNSRLSIPERNKYFGYVVGGHRNPQKYVDDIEAYTSTEGGLDYQAGLVGALAYIVSKLAPADTSKFGKPDTDDSRISHARNVSAKGNSHSIRMNRGAVTFEALDGLTITRVGVYNLQGRQVWSKVGAHRSVNWRNADRPKGMYLVKMTLSDGHVVKRNLMLK